MPLAKIHLHIYVCMWRPSSSIFIFLKTVFLFCHIDDDTVKKCKLNITWQPYYYCHIDAEKQEFKVT